MNRTVERRERAEFKRHMARAKSEQSTLRRSGLWPPWERTALEPGEVGDGPWLGEIHTAFSNKVYAVLVRTLTTHWGPVEHASIHTLSGGDIAWVDKQRIKNELFGEHRTAVEVYPSADELIDQVDAYHLWVLPTGMTLPFSIAQRNDLMDT